jgi:hypothetical protein
LLRERRRKEEVILYKAWESIQQEPMPRAIWWMVEAADDEEIRIRLRTEVLQEMQKPGMLLVSARARRMLRQLLQHRRPHTYCLDEKMTNVAASQRFDCYQMALLGNKFLCPG